MENKKLNKKMINEIAQGIDKQDIVKFIDNNKLEFFRYSIACIKKEDYFNKKQGVENE
jgi:hypothetical protein